VIFGRPDRPFYLFLSNCKRCPLGAFPNLESLPQDYFSRLRGLTIYAIRKYQMKFKFLSAALAGLFLSFSGVVDAAPVRYDYDGSGSGSTVSGYVVVDAHGSASGDDMLGYISEWAFTWDVGGGEVSRTSQSGSLVLGPAELGFRLSDVGAVTAAGFCVGNCNSGDFSNVPYYAALIMSAQPFGEYFSFTRDGVDGDTFHGEGNGVWSDPVPIPVPEPSSLALVALGIMGLALRRFKKQS
jgi:hypothetical protein